MEKKGLKIVDGVPHYDVRELNAGDTITVGQMIAKVTGDNRLQNALLTGEQNVIMAAGISCLMDRVPREIALWAASLVLVDEGYDIDDYIKRDREEAQKEDRLPTPIGNLRAKMEDDIFKEMNSYPVGAYMDIITELFERPSFEDFLVSSSQFGKAVSSLSGRFSKKSKKTGTGKTKK